MRKMLPWKEAHAQPGYRKGRKDANAVADIHAAEGRVVFLEPRAKKPVEILVTGKRKKRPIVKIAWRQLAPRHAKLGACHPGKLD